MFHSWTKAAPLTVLMLMLFWLFLGAICGLWFTEAFCCSLWSFRTIAWYRRRRVYIRFWCYQSYETV